MSTWISIFTDLCMIKIVCETSALQFLFIIMFLYQYAFFILLSSLKVVDSEKNNSVFPAIGKERTCVMPLYVAFLRRRDRPII